MTKLKYFHACKTKQEAKQLFRNLAKQNHPDLFKDITEKEKANQTMIEIMKEYESILKTLPTDKTENNKFTGDDESYNIQASEEMQEIINNISHLPITIEIIGQWLWVSGETKPYKSYLTAYNFLWSPVKKMYYWRLEKDSMGKGYKSKKSIDDIRDTYGSQKVNNTFRPSLT